MRWFFYGTTRFLYCFVFLSLVLVYIAALYSSFFSLEGNRPNPFSFRFSLLSLYIITRKRIMVLLLLLLLLLLLPSRSSSRRCSLRLLLLLFLFRLFVVLPSSFLSSFHSFRPFHRRHDPFSNDRHAFEPRTLFPRPVHKSFPPCARGEEEERHHTLQRHAAPPEAHDRHDDDCTRVSSRPISVVVVLDVKVAQQKSLLFAHLVMEEKRFKKRRPKRAQ